jgi:CcdB protein
MTIRQFDVVATPFRRDRAYRPYVVVLQAAWIESATRICAPLVLERHLRPYGRLNPPFRIEGHKVYFHPVELAALPARVLTQAIDNLETDRDRLIAALDLVFLGI